MFSVSDEGTAFLEVDVAGFRRLSNAAFRENFRMDRPCFEVCGIVLVAVNPVWKERWYGAFVII